ncbi:MAG: hypothetical protein FWG67_00780 [Defluviitaleaceae bacterium]|nr:hypothetical protein [Defluviitaleaceae bacterium]
MRLLLIMILALILLSVLSSLLGPLIVVGIGSALAYYAYQNLVKTNKSILGIIWWIIVGSTGISMIVGALPNFIFVGAIIVLSYIAYRASQSKSSSNGEMNQGSSAFREYESFEAQWRDLTNK